MEVVQEDCLMRPSRPWEIRVGSKLGVLTVRSESLTQAKMSLSLLRQVSKCRLTSLRYIKAIKDQATMIVIGALRKSMARRLRHQRIMSETIFKSLSIARLRATCRVRLSKKLQQLISWIKTLMLPLRNQATIEDQLMTNVSRKCDNMLISTPRTPTKRKLFKKVSGRRLM